MISLCPVRWLFVATHISVVTTGKHGIPFPRNPFPLESRLLCINQIMSFLSKKKKKHMANDVSVRNYGTVSKFRREISGMS